MGLERYRLLLLGLACLLAVGCRGGCACQPNPDLSAVRTALAEQRAADVKMFALRVGHSQAAPRDYFIADPDLPARIPVDFWFWAVETGERLILIDCGFVDPARAERWGIADWRSPDALLSQAGLSASAVTDVVITHGHWDHIGGLGLFPSARVWIDPGALASATEVAARTEPDLERVLTALAGQDRLHRLAGLGRIAPGVVAFPTRLHTAGEWAVAVATPGGLWVFAADEVPLYANLERNTPSGQSADPDRSRALFRALLLLVDGQTRRIVPGHDPAVAERFAPVGDRVVRIGP